MKRPTESQLNTAIAWLNVNDGENGESDACQAVAAWLDDTITQTHLRKAARRGGFPVAKLRARINANR